MKAARIWLLWKSIPNPEPSKKPRKAPYYANGAPRSGELDTPSDRAQLVTFEEALAAYERSGAYAGLASALGPDGNGGHWQGIDLDQIEANGLQDIANRWVRGDCGGWGYIEVSPSGEGAHIVGYGRPFATLGSNGSGIEAYAGGRFFTFTGIPALNESPCHLVDLAEYVERELAPRHSRARAPTGRVAAETVPVDPKTVSELRSALAHLRPDGREQWVAVAHALYELGDTGRGLFLWWSERCDGAGLWDPKEANRVWASLKPTRTGFQAVFKRAQEQGWVNPATNAAQLPPPPPISDETPLEMLERLSVNWNDGSEADVPDIVAGLVADEDVTLLGAHGGVGKSFLALQIACAVAAGQEVLFRKARRCRVLYYSAEDGRKRLTRRLRNLVDMSNFDAALLKANLRVLDASELEPLYGQSEPTPESKRFTQQLGPRADFVNLSHMVEAFDAQLVIIDGASDTFDGNEIARREVRGFIKLLRRVHPRRPIAVLLLVHIDRSSARGNSTNDDGYAGNAAWHNSCRRRMYIQTKVEKDDEGEPVSETFLLRIMKNQDGPPDADMELIRGQHGLWQIAANLGGELARDGDPDHRDMVLRLIDEHYQRGTYMSTSLAAQATTGVYATLRHLPEWPRALTRKRVEALVRQLEREGNLLKETYTRGNRGKAERWRVARSLDLSNYDPAQCAQSGTD